MIPEEERHVPSDQNFRRFQFKINATESFWKFFSKILVNISRLSFFWKFLVPFGISTLYESALVPLVVDFASIRQSYKMAASRQCRGKTICNCSSRFLIAYHLQIRKGLIFWKIVDWSFRIFLGYSPGLQNLAREKFASFSHLTEIMFSRSGKYQGRVCLK